MSNDIRPFDEGEVLHLASRLLAVDSAESVIWERQDDGVIAFQVQRTDASGDASA